MKNNFLKFKYIEWVKKMLERFNQIFHSKILLLFIGLLAGFLIGLLIFVQKPDQKKLEVKRTKLFDQIDYYYQTWLDYQDLNGKELHTLWNNKFHDIEYRLDGNPKNNEHDCSSALYWFFIDLNANFAFCRVELLHERLNFMTKKRKTIKDVKVGDIIIIYVGGNWHVGLIEDKRENKNYVKYMDVNIISDGSGYKQIDFHNRIIKGIYPVTFELWIGDFLRNVKKAKDLHIIIKSEKVKEIKEIKEIPSLKK